MDGLLLVDKPLGLSSFDVIRRLRRQTGMRKIGHAGTLDPLASGLMLMMFGKACKQAEQFSKLDKRYRARIKLGFTSLTGDEEGEKTPVNDREPNRAEVESVLAEFTGEITQVPSAYSAIKINGKEAYKRMRAGEKVEMPSRQVTIYEVQLLNYDYPVIEADFKVSSGTYIRTLAQDIGEALGTGAYLTGLVRTEVGDFALDKAQDLDGCDREKTAAALLEIR